MVAVAGAESVARVRRMDGEAVERWRQEGYLVVEGVLDVEQDLTPVVREYEVLLDELCRRWHAEGRLADDLRRPPLRPAPLARPGRNRRALRAPRGLRPAPGQDHR